MAELHEMTVPTLDPQRLVELRRRAAARLTGTAASKGSIARAADALGVLHALASSPDTASDALTLLHELQVHQIELELQAQELHESRAELESALRRQLELYDHQPVGSFTIDSRFALHELNQTGAHMLGVGRDEAFGLCLDAFLSDESVRRLKLAISSLAAGMRRSVCALRLCPRGAAQRPVLASIGADPAAHRFLVSLTDTAQDAA